MGLFRKPEASRQRFPSPTKHHSAPTRLRSTEISRVQDCFGRREAYFVGTALDVLQFRGAEEFDRRLAGDEDVRQRVLAFIPASQKLREVGKALLPTPTAVGARERILRYFQRYHGTVIHGDELAVVAGISEWARRIRELRVEDGWDIASGLTIREMAEQEPDSISSIAEAIGRDPRQLAPEHYLLVTPKQDREAAFHWNQLNRFRKDKSLSVKNKILDYLKANCGRPVTGEELRYLAGGKTEWARRTRELRTEEGWPVATRNTGRPELPVGFYILEHDRQAEPHDRRIPDDVRVAVLQRDSFACQAKGCGWSRDQAAPDDPRRFLELHHIEHHAAGGENITENLISLCNVHHDALHRGRSIF